ACGENQAAGPQQLCKAIGWAAPSAPAQRPSGPLVSFLISERFTVFAEMSTRPSAVPLAFKVAVPDALVPPAIHSEFAIIVTSETEAPPVSASCASLASKTACASLTGTVALCVVPAMFCAFDCGAREIPARRMKQQNRGNFIAASLGGSFETGRKPWGRIQRELTLERLETRNLRSICRAPHLFY